MGTISDDIWAGHRERTAGGWRPYLYKSLLPGLGFAGLRDAESAFFNLQDTALREGADCKVRIYLGEERRDDLVSKLFERLPVHDRLDEFMTSFTGSDRFGIVINNFEQASPKLAADFALLTNSYFRVFGVPIGGTEQVAFCGNYSGTAFGIHEGFEHALLCHLGPGTKYFYCWSREAYVAATGGREPLFADSPLYESLLETAECFPLEPGDVLYLPAGVYHIGRQTEYSVSIAIPFYTYPLRRFAGRGILPSLIALSFEFEKEGMSSLLPLQSENPIQEPLADLLNAELTHWVKSGVKRLTDFYWARLLSNGGWELPRAIAADLLNDELYEPLPLEPGSIVRLRAPYRIEVAPGLDTEPGWYRAFAAGRSTTLRQLASTLDLTAQLNAGQPVPINTEDGLRAALELSRTGAIELCAA